jgi:hypothetical protein
MNISKKIVSPIDNRIRKIQGSFSWIDHRFISKGIIDQLTPYEIYLYFWLVAVGDRYGISFYSIEKTAAKLKISADHICKARQGLIDKNLIAFKEGLYQVLSL